MSKETLTVEQVNEKVIHLLELKGTTYSIKLTEAQALDMGLSKSDYQRLIDDLKKTNDVITEA